MLLSIGTQKAIGIRLPMTIPTPPTRGVGVVWTQMDPGIGPRSQALSAHLDLNYRQISFRLAYNQGRQENGPSSRQVMVTLRRFFDTVALW